MEVKTLSVLNVIFEMEKLSWRKSFCTAPLWKMVRVWISDLSRILVKENHQNLPKQLYIFAATKGKKKIPDAILWFQCWSCLSQQGIT